MVVAPTTVLDVPAGPEVEVVELPEPVPGAVVVEPVLVLAPVLVVGALLVGEPVVVEALVGAELGGGVVTVAGDAVVSGLGSSRAAVAVVVTMTTGIGVASVTVAGASSGRTRL